MNIPPLSSSSKRRDGFTLIELLVVITIIAVMATLLFSVSATVQNRAKKIQTVSDMRNVKVAIISYYTDYRKYPLNDLQVTAGAADYGNGGYDTVFGDPGGLYQSADLFNVLRAIDDGNFNTNNALNPNKAVYWEGQLAKSATSPHDGITTADYVDTGNVVKKGAFVDPWGNPYIVWIDANNDGDLSQAANWFYHDVSNTLGTVVVGTSPMGIACGSLGPDGEWGTKENGILKGSDDIVTW